MRRAGWWLLLLLCLAPVASARAEDEEPTIEFFYPLVTRRPVIERELDVKVFHEKGPEGRVTVLAPAVEWPLLPRWQIELSLPMVSTDPRDASSQTGIGDIELENKVLLYKSVQYSTLVAAGFEARFPTGSERRGLGGEASIEPFLTAGTAIGPFDLIAEVAYEWNLNAHVKGHREQELTAGAALGFPISRWFTPLVELTSVTRMRGAEEEEDEPRIQGRTQLYVTPGFNVRPWPGTVVRMGIQLPATSTKTFDYTLHAGFVWEF